MEYNASEGKTSFRDATSGSGTDALHQSINLWHIGIIIIKSLYLFAHKTYDMTILYKQQSSRTSKTQRELLQQP